MMNYKDVENWNRKEHFEFFSQFEEPFFGITVDVDVTNLYRNCKLKNESFYLRYLHATLVAANTVEPFRYRIDKNGKVVVYDVVEGSATVLRPDDTFGFSYIRYSKEYKQFAHLASIEIERIQSGGGLEIDVAPTNIIQLSALPWFNFTSMSHARSFSYKGSNPMISFGKVISVRSEMKMPISIHVHHGLMDGVHVGKFLAFFEEMINQ